MNTTITLTPGGHALGHKNPKTPHRELHRHRLALGTSPLPDISDLRPICPPIRDQQSLGACHDALTEVLTDRGFKLFSALDGSERLATVDPNSAELRFEVPIRLVRFHYEGEMYCAANQSLNFKVTPDHQMLVRKWDERLRTLSKEYSFVPACDIGWYAGLLNRVRWQGDISTDTFTLPGIDSQRKGYRQPRSVPMSAWLRFLGIYVAEGTMLKRTQQGNGKVSYKIQIAAFKEREKQFARETLAAIGVHALELNDRFTFENRQVYEAMSTLGLEGVKAGEKFVPQFIFRLSGEMILEFLAGHFAGDGSLQITKWGETQRHYTGSARLSSDLQTLIFLSGNESRVSIREGRTSITADGRTIVGRLPEHGISVCKRKNLSIDRAESLFTEHYDGEVFCAEVPMFHTLVTRRTGKILVSGNCTGVSAAGAIGILSNRQINDGNWTGGQLIASPLGIYYCERQLDGTVDQDAGASIADAVSVLMNTGVVTEADWPYDPSFFDVAPTAQAMADAAKVKLADAAPIDHDLDTIRACLAMGFPIQIGIQVFSSFESAPNGDVPLPDRSKDGLLGGHAIVLVGYDHTQQKFVFRNSWGTAWGNGGYGTLAYPYVLDADLNMELYVYRRLSQLAA